MFSLMPTDLGREPIHFLWRLRHNTADFGVPQNRFRAFLVALKRGKTKPLQWPIPSQGLSSSVGQAIGDLMGARGWRGTSAWQQRANTAAPTIVGGSHKHGGPDLGPTRARKEWARRVDAREASADF